MNNDISFLHWSYTTDEYDIVWLSFDMYEKSTNVLTLEVLEEFENILNNLELQKPKGLIIKSAKKNGFIAGADISSFSKIQSKEEAMDLTGKAHSIFLKLERLPFPTLCLINGFCLGGGLELALACSMRIASDAPSTKIGLPEVRLGIHPGFGGTVRLTRLLGPTKAIPLMMAGKILDARRAKQVGIIDQALPDRILKDAARSLIINGNRKKSKSLLQKITECKMARPLLAPIFERELKKKVNPIHYPAPYAIIDLWKKQSGDDHEMYNAEGASLAELIMHPTARNLTRIFFLQEKLKSLAGDDNFLPKYVHIVGGGVMGGDIAAWCALHNFSVTIQDQNELAIAGAIKRANKLFSFKLRKPHLVRAALDRLQPDIHGTGIKRADVIIEAIFENSDAKRDLFLSLEKTAQPSALFATNTSSIPIEIIARDLQQPERLIGLHFFNPVSRMQLIEVVHTPQTAKEWLMKGIQFSKLLKKLPVPTKSCPGFLVNRVLMPYLHEAVLMASENIPISYIDRAAKKFGMPVGPIALIDMVGLDICQSVSDFLQSDSITMPKTVKALIDQGHKGKKTGRGFYSYKKGKAIPPRVDKRYIPPDDLEDRLILRMLNECVSCLREEVVDGAKLLDAGLIFGTGFAPFTGGPIQYIEQMGASALLQKIQSLEQLYGERFKSDTGWTSLK